MDQSGLYAYLHLDKITEISLYVVAFTWKLKLVKNTAGKQLIYLLYTPIF